jgi:hypothetical protein
MTRWQSSIFRDRINQMLGSAGDLMRLDDVIVWLDPLALEAALAQRCEKRVSCSARSKRGELAHS